MRSAVSRTVTTTRLAFGRRGPTAVFVGTTLAYLAGFLVEIGDLSLQSGAGLSMLVVEEPLARALEPAPGPFAYEGIVILDLGVARYLFSPINALLGLGLAVLVGLNLALSYLAITQPRSCGIGAGTGLVASVPALLSGSACCAPVVLIVLGIQASGLLLPPRSRPANPTQALSGSEPSNPA
ncbi:MAG: hypothetical protein QXG03_09805 [Halalkalicoccus sp.]